jgi:quercetin dioxygenase-like cupin family protein
MEAVATTTVRAVEQAEQRWFYGGAVHTWLLREEDTGGAFFLHEEAMDEGKSTPLHTHPADETMLVLAGSVVVHIDGTDHLLQAGGVAMAPRDVPHAFKVVSPTARLLCLHTPGCCQSFYLGASELLADDTDRVVDVDRVRASGAVNGGITFVGPPPWA